MIQRSPDTPAWRSCGLWIKPEDRHKDRHRHQRPPWHPLNKTQRNTKKPKTASEKVYAHARGELSYPFPNEEFFRWLRNPTEQFPKQRPPKTSSPTWPTKIRPTSDAEATLAEIRVINAEVMDAEAEWSEAKEEAGRRKKLYDAAVARLSARIARVDGPEVLPLIDYAEAQAWQARDLDTLGLSASKTEKLREAGIGTLGELAAYIEAANLKGGGVTWYADIAGMGQAAADEIEERLAEESTRVDESAEPATEETGE